MTRFKIRSQYENVTIDNITARQLDLDNPDNRWLYQRWVFASPVCWLRRLRRKLMR